MDKIEALRISKKYLRKLKKSDFGFTAAYLFGSFAQDKQHDNSDIDIAIVLNDNVEHTFETDVKLMLLRNGEETIIEPHAFSKDEFNYKTPIVNQIIKYGIRLET